MVVSALTLRSTLGVAQPGHPHFNIRSWTVQVSLQAPLTFIDRLLADLAPAPHFHRRCSLLLANPSLTFDRPRFHSPATHFYQPWPCAVMRPHNRPGTTSRALGETFLTTISKDFSQYLETTGTNPVS